MNTGSALMLAFFLLLVPLIMLVMSLIMKKKTPKEINRVVGYRTKRSMASKEAWNYANKRMVEIMTKTGVVMLIISIVAAIGLFMLFKLCNSDAKVIAIIFTVAILFQTLFVCLPMLIIEKELASGRYLEQKD